MASFFLNLLANPWSVSVRFKRNHWLIDFLLGSHFQNMLRRENNRERFF